jgi:hypothetical protein
MGMTMEFLRKIGSYLSLRRQVGDDGQPLNFNLRAMHTINKISIGMFLVALIIIFVKFVVLR